MIALGLIGVLIMGLVLSLLGAGGSILTLPILVYLFSIPVVEATSYSLLIVGFTAFIGSVGHVIRRSIDIKTAIVFGVPSILGVLISRHYILPAVPSEFNLGTTLTKDFTVMTIFSFLMITASIMMIKRNDSLLDTKKISTKNKYLLTIKGLVVGSVTGFVGAGGGFLIIPTLVLFAGLKMKVAVGTSLIIIAFKSIIGFSNDLFNGFQTNWIFILYVILFTISGVILGQYFLKKLADNQLKSFFGFTLLAIGLFIFVEQILRI